jgi:hypothetical protein
VQTTRTPFFFFLVGSVMTLSFGLLAAFAPGSAYVTVNTYFLPDGPFPPSVAYPPLDFSIHLMTIKLIVSAFGGLLGLFSLLEIGGKPQYMGFGGIFLGNIGFLLPTEQRGTFPIYRYFDIPWTGYLLALAGFSMMSISFAMRNSKVPRFTLIGVPLMLTAYLIAPFLITSGNLQLFAHVYLNNSANMLIGFLMLAGHLLLLSGVFAGIIKSSKRFGSATHLVDVNYKKGKNQL